MPIEASSLPDAGLLPWRLFEFSRWAKAGDRLLLIGVNAPGLKWSIPPFF